MIRKLRSGEYRLYSRKKNPASAAALRHEAVNILQGADTAPFLDPAFIEPVAKALRLIRA